MIIAKRLALAAIGVMLLASAVAAEDLSTYRDFHIGMSVAAVSAHAGTSPSAATVVHRRPALIQELVWRSSAVSGPAGDSVQGIVFTFYDDQLFRIVATYDQGKIEGLTDKDLIDGLSVRYGKATTPPATVTSARWSQAYRDNTEQTIARWEDDQHSLNLVRATYGATLSVVMFSKSLDALARTAATEAVRLDVQEAPAREAARQEQQDTATRAAQEKARVANKPTFRP